MKDSTASASQKAIPDQVLKHVSYTAAQMADGSAIPCADQGDIEQQMLIEIAKASPKYDPARGSYYTFCQAVVRNVRSNIFRSRRRSHVDETISLDAPAVMLSESEGVPLLDLIPDDRDHIGEAILRIDVAGVLKGLTPKERMACELIMAGQTTREIPDLLGISRSCFYRHVWPGIRCKFAAAMGRA